MTKVFLMLMILVSSLSHAKYAERSCPSDEKIQACKDLGIKSKRDYYACLDIEASVESIKSCGSVGFSKIGQFFKCVREDNDPSIIEACNQIQYNVMLGGGWERLYLKCLKIAPTAEIVGTCLNIRRDDFKLGDFHNCLYRYKSADSMSCIEGIRNVFR